MEDFIKSQNKENFTDILKQLLLIRYFEEAAKSLYGIKIEGALHPYIGQEAIAVGAISAIGKDDYITSTHRGHGHFLAKGCKIHDMQELINKTFAELMGKERGWCKGRGGSMHLTDREAGNLGANGIVGGGIPIATGSALSAKLKGEDRVTLCFFGDGAVNQGVFHESLNLAGLWKLPVIYICENNQYAVSSSVKETTSISDIARRATSYSIYHETVDGMDPLAVKYAVSKAVESARNGLGPALIECQTYRFGGHGARVGKDDPRPEKERKEWIARDPINRFPEFLIKKGILTAEEIDSNRQRIKEIIKQGVEFADESEYPDPATLYQELYSDGRKFDSIEFREIESFPNFERIVTYREALNEALRERLREDKNIFLIGEDIKDPLGGSFRVTANLSTEFGEERIRNTPISESAIIAVSLGASITGLRPIAEIMYMDFSLLAMDQIANQVAKMRYMTGGQFDVPLTIRTQVTKKARYGPQHSQSLEAVFSHFPGLRIVAPSTPFDAKGLLNSSIISNDPVLFIEASLLYNQKGLVPEEDYFIALGKARVVREGKDVTLISYSVMIQYVLQAAEALREENVDVEVVDLRTLAPLDMQALIESIKKTGRVVIVEPDCKTAGFGGEILSQIVENAFDYLDAPPIRLAGADVPIPASSYLEDQTLPTVKDIVSAIRKITGT